MDTTLCGLPSRRNRADEISRLLPVAVPRVHAVAEVKPSLLLVSPAVGGGAALEARLDVHWDALVAETDGEGEAADSAAGDGDGEGFLGRGGGGHCVSGLGTLV